VTEPVEPIEYRPSVGLGYFLGGTFVVTALVLVWVGWSVRPEDRTAMTGLTRILFTVVSIRLFAWVFAAIMFYLGVRVVRRGARRGARRGPSLVIDDSGLSFGASASVPWSRIAATELDKNGVLLIDVVGAEKVALSSFDLGADPAEVAAEISRRTPASEADGA